jgi:hypothetical protein
MDAHWEDALDDAQAPFHPRRGDSAKRSGESAMEKLSCAAVLRASGKLPPTHGKINQVRR